MVSEQPRSEQDANLELGPEDPLEDPPSWREDDPDRADDDATATPADQLTKPGGGGEPGDEEPTEIAEHAGTDYPTGPEHQAVRIEEG